MSKGGFFVHKIEESKEDIKLNFHEQRPKRGLYVFEDPFSLKLVDNLGVDEEPARQKIGPMDVPHRTLRHVKGRCINDSSAQEHARK